MKKIILIFGLCLGLGVSAEGLYFRHVFQARSEGIPTGDAVLVYGGRMNRCVEGLRLANQLRASLFVSETFGGPKDFLLKIGRQPSLCVGLAQPGRAPPPSPRLPPTPLGLWRTGRGTSRLAASTRVTIDHYARTTDQNARNAVRFLEKGNYQRALLVTNWYHMPRALFLTRLYLLKENQPLPRRSGESENNKTVVGLKPAPKSINSPQRNDVGLTVEPYFFEPIPENILVEPDFWAEMFRFWGSLGRVALAAMGYEKPVFHYFD